MSNVVNLAEYKAKHGKAGAFAHSFPTYGESPASFTRWGMTFNLEYERAVNELYKKMMQENFDGEKL